MSKRDWQDLPKGAISYKSSMDYKQVHKVHALPLFLPRGSHSHEGRRLHGS